MIRPHATKADDAAFTTTSFFEGMFAAAASLRGLMIYTIVISTFASALGDTGNTPYLLCNDIGSGRWNAVSLGTITCRARWLSHL